jgi:hypothetical protein
MVSKSEQNLFSLDSICPLKKPSFCGFLKHKCSLANISLNMLRLLCLSPSLAAGGPHSETSMTRLTQGDEELKDYIHGGKQPRKKATR